MQRNEEVIHQYTLFHFYLLSQLLTFHCIAFQLPTFQECCEVLKWDVVVMLKIDQKQNKKNVLRVSQCGSRVRTNRDMRENICVFIGGWLDFKSRYYSNAAIVSAGIKSSCCWWNVVKITRWWIWYVWAVNQFHLRISTGEARHLSLLLYKSQLWL